MLEYGNIAVTFHWLQQVYSDNNHNNKYYLVAINIQQGNKLIYKWYIERILWYFKQNPPGEVV